MSYLSGIRRDEKRSARKDTASSTQSAASRRFGKGGTRGGAELWEVQCDAARTSAGIGIPVRFREGALSPFHLDKGIKTPT